MKGTLARDTPEKRERDPEPGNAQGTKSWAKRTKKKEFNGSRPNPRFITDPRPLYLAVNRPRMGR